MSCQISIKVTYVDHEKVTMEAEGFKFTFVLQKNGKVKLSSSFRLDAQIHDPSECYLSKYLYWKASRQALAILKDHHQRKLDVIEKRQLQEMRKKQLREMNSEVSSGERCQRRQCGMKLDYISQSPCPHCRS